MRSRPRRMIFLTMQNHYHSIFDNSETPRYSVHKFQYPMEKLKHDCPRADVVGTFNGLVLLQYYCLGDCIGWSRYVCRLILYNPFTRASKLIPLPPSMLPCGYDETLTYACGFGYGATPGDLKIVVFKHEQGHCVCLIFSLKEGTWSSFRGLEDIEQIKFQCHVGTFHNGFLYWISRFKNTLVAVDVENIVYLEVQPPVKGVHFYEIFFGTLDGCLCLLNESKNGADFDLWVMNQGKGDEDIWSKRRSFTLSLDCTIYGKFHHPLCVLDDGRILVHATEKDAYFTNDRGLLYIYDTSDNSRTMMNVSLDGEDFLMVNGLNYVESLISPSDAYFGYFPQVNFENLIEKQEPLVEEQHFPQIDLLDHLWKLQYVVHHYQGNQEMVQQTMVVPVHYADPNYDHQLVDAYYHLYLL
ncbi:F-box domain-containing protein [Artemisia annua]|uniref:F-box domain-containing protein n=1 Tax=Artemisia annua TaxID=35608 RepID=A0A2U1LUY9_ARTAN|nr:F-box domain-containing protein [Artemisia annua]